MLFDADGKIKRYESPEDILMEFFDLRLQYYERRRVSLLQARRGWRASRGSRRLRARWAVPLGLLGTYVRCSLPQRTLCCGALPPACTPAHAPRGRRTRSGSTCARPTRSASSWVSSTAPSSSATGGRRGGCAGRGLTRVGPRPDNGCLARCCEPPASSAHHPPRPCCQSPPAPQPPSPHPHPRKKADVEAELERQGFDRMAKKGQVGASQAVRCS